MADVKNVYPASSALTYTSLASLGTSPTWIAGAESSAYDNSSNLYPDVRIHGHIAVHATVALTANTQIIVWIAAEDGDGAWPLVLDGTDSVETWANAEQRDAACRIAAVINIVATTAGIVYNFEVGSVAALFGGFMPKKFVLFIAHNTGQSFAASGSAVNVHPIYQTVT